MVILGAFVLPESPSWLIINGKRDRAAQSLRTFNGPYYNAEKAIAILEAAVAKEKELEQDDVSYLNCFRGTNLRRTMISCMPFMAQQFSRATFVAGYPP
jgi:hypothetical protein